MSADRDIERNVRAHDRVSRRYEWIHGEIFNPIEQARLAESVRVAVSRIETRRTPLRAHDAGCGTGNLTRHLLGAGLHVTAADVSTESLAQLRKSIRDPEQLSRLETLRLNGRDMSETADGTFDLVAAYSLLHHIPDYLGFVREMARVLSPGGVVYLEHEGAKCSWTPSAEYREYVKRAKPRWSNSERWRKFLVPENYWFKLVRLRDPRRTAEGDLHVWPDDHIEWDDIVRVLKTAGVPTPEYEEYLLYSRGFDEGVYREYRGKCADVAHVVGVKMAVEGPPNS